MERSTKKPCYLCGRRTDRRKRKAPFDEFDSQVVDEIGFGIHMVLYDHTDPGECLNVQAEDSCHFLDYQPNKMSADDARERS